MLDEVGGFTVKGWGKGNCKKMSYGMKKGVVKWKLKQIRGGGILGKGVGAFKRGLWHICELCIKSDHLKQVQRGSGYVKANSKKS